MSKRVQVLQIVGIAILAGSAFFPAMRYERHPRLGLLQNTYYEISSGTYVGGTEQVPSRVLAQAIESALEPPHRFEPLWRQRAWYPFLLAPLWLLALLLVRYRLAVGYALLFLSLGLAVLEAIYLLSDYAPFLPPPLGVVEGVVAWIVIAFILFWRRRPDRAVRAVSATVAAQALLCLAHLLTLPMTMARPWFADYGIRDVARAVFSNFPPAFWIACGGLLVIALPVYARRTAG